MHTYEDMSPRSRLLASNLGTCLNVPGSHHLWVDIQRPKDQTSSSKADRAVTKGHEPPLGVFIATALESTEKIAAPGRILP